MDIGRAIKLCREAVGLSQREAADDLGITAGYLHKLEHAYSSPSYRLLCRIEDRWGPSPMLVAWLYDWKLLDPGSRTVTGRFRRAYFTEFGISG